MPGNPYNPTRPGNLFVGYERLREKFLHGFVDGNSFAVLGGRRCGKTSFLKQIEQDVNTQGLRPFRALPRYLDLLGLDRLTPALLFETIYGLVVQEVEAPRWSPGETGMEYLGFLAQLDKARTGLDQQYGSDWLVILLVDELDAALSKLPDDQFFQNLRNFLMVSRFHRHFRMVASGVSSLEKLIFSGSSPLNNLRHHHLGVLHEREARQLITAGFHEGMGSDVEGLLLKVTGRHPYLLQGLLEKLWEADQKEFDKVAVRRAAKEFLNEHYDFTRWLEAFGPSEHAVYQCLAAAPDGTLHVNAIRQHIKNIDPSLAPEIDNALTVLSYHGVIEDSDPDEPQLSGTIFRDWYRDHHQPRAESPVSASAFPAKDHPLSVQVQVNPTFSLTGGQSTINVGLTADQVMDVFEKVKTEVSKLAISERAKMEVQHELDKGRIEIKEPKVAGTPNKEVVKTSLEKATSLLKSAGATTDALSVFIEKAEKIGPYLGKAAGWLAVFL